MTEPTTPPLTNPPPDNVVPLRGEGAPPLPSPEELARLHALVAGARVEAQLTALTAYCVSLRACADVVRLARQTYAAAGQPFPRDPVTDLADLLEARP